MPLPDSRLRSRLSVLVFAALCLGCGEATTDSPARSDAYSTEYDVIPLAGTSWDKTRKDSADWVVTDPQDSIFHTFRVPRSDAEFRSQVAQGIWARTTDAQGRTVFVGQQFALASPSVEQIKRWRPFRGDTLVNVQGCGEEMAFALKIPAGDTAHVEYKINYSGWTPLVRGRDYGVLGLDSLRFAGTDTSRIGEPGLQLLGVPLTVRGKSVLIEGLNLVSIRIVRGQTVLRERTFQLRYAILGLTVYESDSLGNQIDTSRMLLNHAGHWSTPGQKTTYVYLRGTPTEFTKILLMRTFQETLHPGPDSTLAELPHANSCAELVDDGWCHVKSGATTIVQLKISRSQFGAYTTYHERERGIRMRGSLLVTPGFHPYDMPFKLDYSIYLQN